MAVPRASHGNSAPKVSYRSASIRSSAIRSSQVKGTSSCHTDYGAGPSTDPGLVPLYCVVSDLVRGQGIVVFDPRALRIPRIPWVDYYLSAKTAGLVTGCPGALLLIERRPSQR